MEISRGNEPGLTTSLDPKRPRQPTNSHGKTKSTNLIFEIFGGFVKVN